MKKFLITSILATMFAVGTALMAQDYPDEYLGLPGDNFNLYAVMNLFQQSETIEGFEKNLNDENTRINNLDLNNDNNIDYIKVNDYVDGNVHTIVLQALLDRNENQDVAVFTVQKLRDGSVQIQLIGDEALYGKNYIVEPIYAETPNPGYTGRQNVNVVRTTYVEVATWPLVRYIYLPDYRIWRSSWYWGYYPSYWNPWRPYYWHYYYGYHYNWYPQYYSHFHRYDRPRYDRWNDFYYRDKRVYSRNVTININDGRYKNTYSRPEMRREGEALYAKVHPDRASSMSTGNSSRRSSSQAATSRQSAGTGNAATRRSTGTVNQNSRTNSGQGQSNSGNARRSSTTVNRSTTTVNNRANSNSTAGQSTVSNRRSSETANSRPVSSSGSSQRAEPARTTKQQASSKSSTARRSTEKAQKETTTRQGTSKSSSKESETKSSRRK